MAGNENVQRGAIELSSGVYEVGIVAKRNSSLEMA